MPRHAPPVTQPRPFNRRRTLGTLGAVGTLGTLALLGCGAGDDDATSTAGSTTTAGDDTTSGTSTTTATTCSVVPEETAGPYPADGSQASNRSYNVLALAGIVRSDIRSSIGSGVQALGVPMTLQITLTSTATATTWK